MEDSIPPAYVAWRAGTPNRVVVQARQAGNRILGVLKGLQILALGSIQTSSDTRELEGRQMKQCLIKY